MSRTFAAAASRPAAAVNVASAGRVASCAGTNSQAEGLFGIWTEGDIVEVHGLQGSPQYNGKRGEIVAIDAERGRYRVALDGIEKRLNIRPTNLRLIDSV